MIFAMVLPVFAGPFEDAIGKFANDDYSDTEDAVGMIATSRQSAGLCHHQRAAGRPPDGRSRHQEDLLTQPDGKIIDAATGAPSPAFPIAPRPVRINNHLRRAVEAALGGLTLSSPDPDKRIEAAQSVFKTHDEAMLPLIDNALKKETNKDARQALTAARAAIMLFKDDASEEQKLDAVANIRARGDQEALAMLTECPRIIDAATGATVASMPDSAAAVRLNNKLRREVEAALGGADVTVAGSGQAGPGGAVGVQDP